MIRKYLHHSFRQREKLGLPACLPQSIKNTCHKLRVTNGVGGSLTQTHLNITSQQNDLSTDSHTSSANHKTALALIANIYSDQTTPLDASEGHLCEILKESGRKMRGEREISQVMQTEREEKATERHAVRHGERQRRSQKQKIDAAWPRRNDCSFVRQHLEAKGTPAPRWLHKGKRRKRGKEGERREKGGVSRLEPNGSRQHLHRMKSGLLYQAWWKSWQHVSDYLGIFVFYWLN